MKNRARPENSNQANVRASEPPAHGNLAHEREACRQPPERILEGGEPPPREQVTRPTARRVRERARRRPEEGPPRLALSLLQPVARGAGEGGGRSGRERAEGRGGERGGGAVASGGVNGDEAAAAERRRWVGEEMRAAE